MFSWSARLSTSGKGKELNEDDFFAPSYSFSQVIEQRTMQKSILFTSFFQLWILCVIDGLPGLFSRRTNPACPSSRPKKTVWDFSRVTTIFLVHGGEAQDKKTDSKEHLRSKKGFCKSSSNNPGHSLTAIFPTYRQATKRRDKKSNGFPFSFGSDIYHGRQITPKMCKSSLANRKEAYPREGRRRRRTKEKGLRGVGKTGALVLGREKSGGINNILC